MACRYIMKKHLPFAILVIVIIGSIVWKHHPKHLVSSAEYIPEFFNLQPNSMQGITVLDELHSQGKTTFSFGVNHYWLKFQSTDLTINAIKEAGGIEKDSIWSITKQRGNYIGTLMVSQKDNTGHLRYSENQE